MQRIKKRNFDLWSSEKMETQKNANLKRLRGFEKNLVAKKRQVCSEKTTSGFYKINPVSRAKRNNPIVFLIPSLAIIRVL